MIVARQVRRRRRVLASSGRRCRPPRRTEPPALVRQRAGATGWEERVSSVLQSHPRAVGRGLSVERWGLRVECFLFWVSVVVFPLRVVVACSRQKPYRIPA
jgi:hypothetical protein